MSFMNVQTENSRSKTKPKPHLKYY